jgi:hypothetical protein
MGCEEKTVEKIIRRYVGRHAATRAVVERTPAMSPYWTLKNLERVKRIEPSSSAWKAVDAVIRSNR